MEKCCKFYNIYAHDYNWLKRERDIIEVQHL